MQATSNTAIIMVNAAPSVSISPESVTLDVGQPRVFNSTILGGTSPYSYQWYVNGLAQGTGSSWTFTPSSSGSYSVYLIVTDGVGAKAESNVARITVNSALSVAVSPTSVTLHSGQSQSFTATVSGGASSYSYQWYLNGAAVSGATRASWAFTPSAAGSYTVYVKVTDSVGMQTGSNTASIRVQISVQIKFISGPHYTQSGIEYYIAVFSGARPICLISNYW
jgi:hypothetical protein